MYKNTFFKDYIKIIIASSFNIQFPQLETFVCF